MTIVLVLFQVAYALTDIYMKALEIFTSEENRGFI